MLTPARPATVVRQLVLSFRSRNERGASLVEYALLVALIALVCIIAIAFLGTETSEYYSQVGNSITAAN